MCYKALLVSMTTVIQGVLSIRVLISVVAITVTVITTGTSTTTTFTATIANTTARSCRQLIVCLCRLSWAWKAITILGMEGKHNSVLVQAELGMEGKGKAKLAATAFPAKAMAQVTAAYSQPAVDVHATASSKRHVMPCSGHTSPAQASQGVPTQPVQPLFSAPQGCTLGVGQEREVDRGVRLGSGSDSRVAGVRYCLSSSQPAVGAGIWEEQTTRHADLTA